MSKTLSPGELENIHDQIVFMAYVIGHMEGRWHEYPDYSECALSQIIELIAGQLLQEAANE